MNYIYINIFLVVVIVLLIVMKYLVNKNFELFSVGSQRANLLDDITSRAPLSDGKQVKINDVKEGSEYVKNSESMTDMLKALENVEQLCWDMEQRQDAKDKDKLIRLQNSKISDLEEQDRQIAELKNLFTFLKAEKMKKENVKNKCKNSRQEKINDDFNLVKKLANKNLLKDESINLDLDLSKFLGVNQPEVQTQPSKNPEPVVPGAPPSCPSMNKRRYINANTLRDKCHGCDVEKLKDNSEFLQKQF